MGRFRAASVITWQLGAAAQIDVPEIRGSLRCTD
jgi:hypothetical protein